MIKIIEDGMEFVMEKSNDAASCKTCIAKGLRSTCADDFPELRSFCVSNNKYRCTSATPVQDEAHIYSSIDPENATNLIGKKVEFSDDCKTWSKPMHLHNIDLSASYYKSCEDGAYYEYMREIATRRLTQAQIIEAHPDLEGVELVGGWE